MRYQGPRPSQAPGPSRSSALSGPKRARGATPWGVIHPPSPSSQAPKHTEQKTPASLQRWRCLGLARPPDPISRSETSRRVTPRAEDRERNLPHIYTISSHPEKRSNRVDSRWIYRRDGWWRRDFGYMYCIISKIMYPQPAVEPQRMAHLQGIMDNPGILHMHPPPWIPFFILTTIYCDKSQRD